MPKSTPTYSKYLDELDSFDLARLRLPLAKIRREREAVGLLTPTDLKGWNEEFAAKYWDNPAGFVQDCFIWRLDRDEGPTFYQDEILGKIPTERRVSVRGPHGLGKTAMMSWIILWFSLTRDARGVDWKAVITAGGWRQITRFLFPEVKKWVRRVNWQAIGRSPFKEKDELLDVSISLKFGQAFGVASDNAGLIEGAHADELLYIFDESKSIRDQIWAAAEGAFSGAGSDTHANAYAVAVSTPGEPQGQFYAIHQRKPGLEDWWARHVTLADCIKAKRISQEWADQRKRQWGETSALYQNRVLGEFAADDENAVIPLSWVEAAQRRWYEWRDLGKPGILEQIGIDFADQGGDKTVIACRYSGYKIDALKSYSKADTMETVNNASLILDNAARVFANREHTRLKEEFDRWATAARDQQINRPGYPQPLAPVPPEDELFRQAKKKFKVVGDVIGIGAGPSSRLRQLGYNVVGFNASEKAEGKDITRQMDFINKRAEAWWWLRTLLDPANGYEVALPDDDDLTGDLTTPHWFVNAGGRIQVEAKADIRERIGRSTDNADAVIMACYKAAAMGIGIRRLK